LTLLCCEGLRVNRAIPMRSAVGDQLPAAGS
jgi:hypothetical protein